MAKQNLPESVRLVKNHFGGTARLGALPLSKGMFGCSAMTGEKLVYVHDAGCLAYQRGLELQERAWEMVQAGECQGVLILCEHEPVITFGRAGGEETLCLPEAALSQQGVACVRTKRGGAATCHMPGQLVAYPLLQLSHWRKDAHWYLHSLEQTVIEALACFSIRAGRKEAYTGVWVDEQKICAIGVGLRRWVTSHGLAVNIVNELDLFEAIIPCGIKDFSVTSLSALGVVADTGEFSAVLRACFEHVFACRLKALPRLLGPGRAQRAEA